HVTVDGQDVEERSVYVTPGAHVIEGRAGEKTVRQPQQADAGAVVSVALVPPSPEPLPAAPPAAPETTAQASRGWSATGVVVGGAITAVLGGFTIWSGVDTLSQKRAFDGNPTQQNLDDGRSKQTRTNVLIGATAIAAAFTAVTAIWLVDWRGASRERGTEV